ncbi:unnamed protein product [Dicrocoelium dendriticum]|nr:unnamed protein product [Dicrocoelium dendriticum]
MLTRSTSITSEDQTLIFKHLPEDLTANDCAEFLSNLGATSSSYFGNKGPLRNCALAEFSSTEHAWKVIKSVHQRVILRRRISVEFFPQSDSLFKCATIEPEAECEISHLSPLPHLPEQEPIVPRWDISLSVPVNMYYKYPSPSPSILTNIIRCMASCPAFYTQVGVHSV